MSRKRFVLGLISLVTAVSFLWTNCIWGMELGAYKLSSQSQLADVLKKARIVYTGTALHSNLLKLGVKELRILYKDLEKIRERLRETIGDKVDELKTLIFQGEGGVAYYTFTPDGYFYRFITAPIVDDPFYRLIERFIVSRSMKVDVPVKGYTYYQEIIQISPEILNLINTCLGELYPQGIVRVETTVDDPKNSLVNQLGGLISREVSKPQEYAEAIVDFIIAEFNISREEMNKINFEIGRRMCGRTERWYIPLTIKSEGKDLVTYIVKSVSYPEAIHKIHGNREIEDSVQASRYGLGPKVIYTDKEKMVMVEEYLEDSIQDIAQGLTDEEKITLAERFAEKLFLMQKRHSPGEEWIPSHAFDDFPVHTKIVGRGKNIDVKWIDWGRHGSKRDNEDEFVSTLKFIIQQIYAYLESAEAIAHFIIRIKQLAREESKDVEDLYKEGLKEAQEGLTGYSECYLPADRKAKDRWRKIFGKVDEIIARSEGGDVSFLEKGWVLANHIFMSIHAAMLFPIYIDKILGAIGIVTIVCLTPASFLLEVISGVVFAFLTFYIAVGWHERGHFLAAVDQITLNKKGVLENAQEKMKQGLFKRLLWNIEMLAKIPIGEFPGINRFGLTYSVDASYNPKVSAAGPKASRNLFWFSLPFAAVLIVTGFLTGTVGLLYMGRIFLGLSVVGLLDFVFADSGEYKKFKESLKGVKMPEKRAGEEVRWIDMAKDIKDRMIKTRLQELTLPNGVKIRAPWGYRNCAMGGAHTEREYPESNISMQEGMFIPLTASNYEDAQRMTVELQNKLKDIIGRTPGCRVMGIGLEGGLATYITKDPLDRVPEQKMWRLMKQAIAELEDTFGVDVVIALDPAASELQNAYNERIYGDSDEAKKNWETGKYRFWRYRDEQVIMTSDEILELYKKAIEEGIPIVSIEDGFAENDYNGWKKILSELGDKLFIIGDDLVTTNDAVIEECVKMGLINTALIKANQIGTLSETILAMLTALGYSMELVVSHRSKSPNDDMEAQIALSAEAMGLKAGGGANTERLVKYGAIIKLMKDTIRKSIAEAEGISKSSVAESQIENFLSQMVITGITAYEEATNAGIPTVGVKVTAGIPGGKFEELLVFTGSTPLGTSAGSGEAIHLIDSTIEKSQIIDNYPDLFERQDDGTYRFGKEVTRNKIDGKNDENLSELWKFTHRYEGKGCINAVRNVEEILSKLFFGRKISELGCVGNIDRILMGKEFDTAVERGKIDRNVSVEDRIRIMQRKGNLGMNAILSMSLALARLSGAINGKALWEILRDEMSETIARAIMDNGGLEVLAGAVSDEKISKMKNISNKPLSKILLEELSYNELVKGLQCLTRKLQGEGKLLHEVLRKALPVYEELNRLVEDTGYPQGSHLVRVAPEGEEIAIKSDEEFKPYNETVGSAMDRLRHIYGPGIFTMVREIWIVENLNVKGLYPEGRAPLASYNPENGLLKIDKKLFEYERWVLFEELEHEYLESIGDVIPGCSRTVSDVVSTFINVLRFLDPNMGVTKDKYKVDVEEYREKILTALKDEMLDPDDEYLALLRGLLKLEREGRLSEDIIVASVVGYVMRTKVYEKVRDELGLPKELAMIIKLFYPLLEDALRVFGEIKNAKLGKELIEKVKETKDLAISVVKTFTGVVRIRGLERFSNRFARIVSSSVKVVSKMKEIASLPLAMAGDRYCIVLDKDRIPDELRDDWKRRIKELEGNGMFKVVYSMDEALKDYEHKNIIHLIDPADIKEGMPEGILYLPMPYIRSSLYMAGHIVMAGGVLDKINPLIKGLILDLYREIFSSEVTDEDLWNLFNAPWKILPRIEDILMDLNNLNRVLAEIEKAA